MTGMTGLTVAQALAEARRLGIERLDARILLSVVVGQAPSWLVAHDDHALSPQQGDAFERLVERRAANEPLAYLLGEQEFHGLTLQVNSNVLVPRPDTETLVDWGLELLRSARLPTPARIVDLGTGSGAVALAIRHRSLSSTVTAVDASAAALAVAAANAQRLGIEAEWIKSDWWEALSDRRFHLALSNPPYIALGDPHLEQLGHEPSMALTSGLEGLDAIERIVQGAPQHLELGGWLLLEHGHQQPQAVCALLAKAGFSGIETRRDLAGRARCSGGYL